MIRKIRNTKYEILPQIAGSRCGGTNSKKGFTIIELLIYISIFVIILAVAADFLFQSQFLAANVAQYQGVDRNARVALLEMTQAIRGSSTTVTSPALGASSSDLYLNSSAIRYFVNAAGILQKTENSVTSDLTSNGVTIQNFTVTTRGEAGVPVKPPTVSISFDVRSNTLLWGQGNYIVKNFQTTVQLR